MVCICGVDVADERRAEPVAGALMMAAAAVVANEKACTGSCIVIVKRKMCVSFPYVLVADVQSKAVPRHAKWKAVAPPLQGLLRCCAAEDEARCNVALATANTQCVHALLCLRRGDRRTSQHRKRSVRKSSVHVELMRGVAKRHRLSRSVLFVELRRGVSTAFCRRHDFDLWASLFLGLICCPKAPRSMWLAGYECLRMPLLPFIPSLSISGRRKCLLRLTAKVTSQDRRTSRASTASLALPCRLCREAQHGAVRPPQRVTMERGVRCDARHRYASMGLKAPKGTPLSRDRRCEQSG